MLIDIPHKNKARVIIIGGGFGGLRVARGLLKQDFQVVMIDRNNHHTFQPLLYQVATAALEPGSIAYPIRKIFNRYKNFYFRMGEVKEIFPSEKKLCVDNDHIFYDYLIIATGAKTNYFGNEGLMVNSMSMKNVVEAIDLRNIVLQNFEKSLTTSNETAVIAMRNIVIAGGGPTGVELAGSLGELKSKVIKKDFPEIKQEDIHIYLVHAGSRILDMLSEKSSSRAQKYLEDLGVTVMLNTFVKDYTGDQVITSTGADLYTRTLIWTAGVTGDPVKGLDQKCINKGNRISVDEYNKVEGYDNIFAIGDVAVMITPEYPRGHPQVAPAAMQQGTLLAKNLGRKIKGEPLQKFVYKDKGSMATVGKNKAVAELWGMKLGGFWAWIIWMFVHLMSLVGFRNRILVLINWIIHYIDSDRGMRLIIRPFDLQQERRKRKRELEGNVEI